MPSVGDRTRKIVALMLGLIAISIAEGATEPQKFVPASYVLAKIEAGQPAEFDNCIIIGGLNLSALKIEGPVHFNHTLFQNSVNFNSTILNGTADFSSSTFNGTAYFMNSTFNDPAHFGYTTFDGTASFMNSDFNGPASFWQSNFNDIADFSDSKFNSDVYFYYTNFGRFATFARSNFAGYANFAGSRFNPAYFSNAKFNGKAEFVGSKFNGNTFFSYTKFNKTANFIGSTFNHYYDSYVSFVSSSFAGDVSFMGSKFNTAQFNAAKFNNNADFGSSSFNGDALFSQSAFNGYADFKDSVFNGKANFTYSRFNDTADFTYSRFNDIADFDESKFDKLINFRKATFNKGLSFNNLNFEDIYLEWDAINNINRDFEGKVYLSIIESYKARGFYSDADNCYYAFRKEQFFHRTVTEDPLMYLFDLGAWTFYGFGKRPHFTLIWSVVFIVLFGCFWIAMGSKKSRSEIDEYSQIKKWPGGILKALFFSATLFLSGTKLFVDPPAIPELQDVSRSVVNKVFIAERLLGALFSVLFFLAVTGMIIKS